MAGTSPAMTKRKGVLFGSPKPPPIVRRLEIERGPEWYDAARIDVAHADVIVALDVIHVHRVGDARHLIEFAQVVRQVRIVDDAAQIALEVAVIDRVKSKYRGEQPPVRFGQRRAAEIALA